MAPQSPTTDPRFKRNPVVRFLHARPRLMASVLFGVVVFAGVSLGDGHRLTTRALIAWDVGVLAYLALSWHMMATSTVDHMRQRARREDDGRAMVLVLSVLATLACLGAIFSELAIVKQLSNSPKLSHVLLVVLTIVAAWCFVHTMFALHYAHDYYLAPVDPPSTPLGFPGEDHPDYFDFLYFAFVIGTSGQTADVSIRSRSLRRVGLAHCTLAFFFNATVLALTINIAASLIQP